MSKVNELNKKADSILKARVEEQQQLADLLRDKQNIVNQLTADMDRATARGDLTGYQKAKRAREDATDALEMYGSRNETLESKPLVDGAEYNKAIADIMGEISAANNRAMERLTALADEARKIADELEVTIHEGNAVLHKWQYDVYRDLPNQKGVFNPRHDKTFRDLDVVLYGRMAVEDPRYKSFRGL